MRNELAALAEDAVEAELLSGPGLPVEDARHQVVFLDRRLPFREILERLVRDLNAWAADSQEPPS
jgi:hypothetical protein